MFICGSVSKEETLLRLFFIQIGAAVLSNYIIPVWKHNTGRLRGKLWELKKLIMRREEEKTGGKRGEEKERKGRNLKEKKSEKLGREKLFYG